MRKFQLNQLAFAVVSVIATQSAFADIKSADKNTQVIGKSGIEIVNIAAPNKNGLSHNKYEKFNVDKKGAVLNNALQNGRSQLAGDLQRNPHLKQQAATVILNEVVSRNPSKLAGKQEIFGQRADYVLANPNGISCDGCGFINTQRASLVVGKPTIEKDRLTGYKVEGDKALTATGKINHDNLDYLDLIAPKVEVKGDVRGAKNINIVLGRNQVQLDAAGNPTVTKTTAQGAVLDGQFAGSMHAGRIRIHSADHRATVNVAAADIQAKEASLTAGNLILNGKVTKTHKRDEQSGKTAKKVDQLTRVDNSQQHFQKTNVHADKLVVDVKNRFTAIGADIQAQQATIAAGEIQFGTQTTTKARHATHNQSKGAWYRKESDSSKEQSLHRTTVVADDLTLIASKNKITGQAVKLSANRAGIYAEKGIQLGGAITTNEYIAKSDFRNETARLKTGNSHQRSNEQTYTGSELLIKNAGVIGAKGDINLAGTKVAADDLIVKTPAQVRISSEASRHTYQLVDQQKFWGGIAGSKRVGAGKNEYRQNGADVTVANNLRIEADKGATITGSRVIAKGDATLIAKNGNLNVDASVSRLAKHDSQRVGTAFDILKARNSVYAQSSTSNAAKLQSHSNLYLSTDKQVNVRGSEVLADQLLDIAAISGVNVSGARNTEHVIRDQAGFSTSAKVDKLDAKFDHMGAIQTFLDKAKGQFKLEQIIDNIIEGVTVTKVAKDLIDPKNVLGIVKDHLTLEAQGSAKIGYSHTREETNAVTHTAANIAGGKTNINTHKVVVEGSKVGATSGDLNINADRIITNAQHNTNSSNVKQTDVGLTVKGQATLNGVTVSTTLGVSHSDKDSSTSTAQGSTLSANRDVNLTANRIDHQGSTITAGRNINQNAAQINHSAATNSAHSNENKVNVGLTSTAGIDKSKALSASVALSAEGSNSNAHSSTASVTHLTAGHNINVNANRLNDEGTKYEAGQDVNLVSKTHNLLAAHNESSNQNTAAGVNIKVSGSSKDLNTVNLNVAVGTNFETNKATEKQGEKASVKGTNVHIETGRLTSQADIAASNNVVINASQGANFKQVDHTKTEQGGGVNAKVGVGALVVPAASAAIPSVDVSVAANGHNSNSKQGTAGSITAGNLAINSPKVNLQGTNVTADKATINTNSFTASAVNNHNNALSVGVELGAKVGAGASNLALNGSVDVKHENSKVHTGTHLAVNDLTINANSAKLVGTSTQGENLTINANNLSVIATPDSVHKTNVVAGLSLNGGIAKNQWTPNSGGANLAVDVVRNETHTPTALNSTNLNVNANNVLLHGSQVNADNASGKIGSLTAISTVDKVNEVSVNVSVNGGGKVTAYPKDKWTEAAKKDWKEGSLAGVKADVKFGVSVNKQGTYNIAGMKVRTQNGKVLVAKQIRNNLPPVSKIKGSVNGHVSTNAKDMIKRGKADIQNKRTPWVQVKR